VSLSIYAVTEGYPDEVVVRSLCREAGISVDRIFNTGGKSKLDERIRGYNQAAHRWYWLVLRDLNSDADCAPKLRRRLLPEVAPFMAFRIAVRAVEAWLMADADALADFLRISRRQVPADPERVQHPKAEMVRLASNSRSRAVRQDMVPRPGSGASQGPGYAALLAEFAEQYWRPRVAANCSDSLNRCLRYLAGWSPNG
jgi:hypothetical protein